MANAGFRVLIHDRRNCGASDVSIDGDESEYDLWADDLHALLAQLGALPAIVGGTPISHSLVAAAYLGVGVLLLLVAAGTAAFASDRPLELAGRGVQWLLNKTVRRRHPVAARRHRRVRL